MTTEQRAPAWTEEELQVLYGLFYNTYEKNSPSRFFQAVENALPHRSMVSTLRRVSAAQQEQLLPYYGQLPMTLAKEWDTINAEMRNQALANYIEVWKEGLKRKKEQKTVTSDSTDAIVVLLTTQNELISRLINECERISKFVAGTYRLANGEDGKGTAVRILTEPYVPSNMPRRDEW